MLSRLLAAAVVAFALQCAHAQQPDPNLQNLLAALMNGGEAMLVTPLTTGMVQVTSFRSPVRLAAADVSAYLDRARQELAALGVAQPSAEVIARMLAGGPIEAPNGRFTLPGLLTQRGIAATIVSQVVAAGAPVPGYGSAAAGGSAAPAPAREVAIQQLAALGIINPSEDQIRTALVGGTITTVNGPYQLPGLITR